MGLEIRRVGECERGGLLDREILSVLGGHLLRMRGKQTTLELGSGSDLLYLARE